LDDGAGINRIGGEAARLKKGVTEVMSNRGSVILSYQGKNSYEHAINANER